MSWRRITPQTDYSNQSGTYSRFASIQPGDAIVRSWPARPIPGARCEDGPGAISGAARGGLLQKRIRRSFVTDRGWFRVTTNKLVVVAKGHDFCGNAIQKLLVIAARQIRSPN